MRTTSKRVVGTLVGGSTALALAVGSAWATPPPPVRSLTVAGGGVSTAGLYLGSDVSASAQVALSIDLAFRDEAGAESYATAVSTPGDPDYGKFLSSGQFADRFGPRAADVAAIRAWVRSKGLAVDEYVANQVLLVHGTAGRVAAAFGGVGLRTASAHGTTGIVATSRLTMPASLAPAVAAVGGLSGPAAAVTADSTVANSRPLLTGAPGVSAATAAAPCATYFGQLPLTVARPLPFKAAASSAQECSYFPGLHSYGFAAGTAKLRALNYYNPKFQGQGRTVGIVLWGNDPAAVRAANAQAAFNGVAGLAKGQYTSKVSRRRVSGCQRADSSAYLEQDLDIQAIRTTAPAAKIVYYANSRCVVAELSLASAVNDNKVQVINNSWGYANFEYDPANRQSPNFASGNIIHQSLIKAANEGITVLFASGDSGSGVLTGRVRKGTPQYPATDPFAVAVGGIGFATGPRQGVAWRSGWEQGYFLRSGARWVRMNPVDIGGPNAVGSTGGVSRYWKAPSWQKLAGVAAGGRRAVPDLANSADSFFNPFLVAYAQGGGILPTAVGGTSVASPLTAGDVVDALNATHRARAGLITPALYAARRSGAVVDVRFRQDATLADIDGEPVLVGGEVPQENLRSRAGWDNVTGLGAVGPRFTLAVRKR